MTEPLTPSNQHSAEAQAAQAERQALWEKRNPDYRGEQVPAWSDSFMEGFDRGRASAPVSTITDRELFRVVEGVVIDKFKVRALGLSDAITDALLSSGVLVDRGESDAQALELTPDTYNRLMDFLIERGGRDGLLLAGEVGAQIGAGAQARLRSGKAEA